MTGSLQVHLSPSALQAQRATQIFGFPDLFETKYKLRPSFDNVGCCSVAGELTAVSSTGSDHSEELSDAELDWSASERVVGSIIPASGSHPTARSSEEVAK
jgi:hypothetical protein